MNGLGLPQPRPDLRVVPKPVHNTNGTIFALAKQMLMDLDRNTLTTAVPTATLELLLTTLIGALGPPQPPMPATAPQEGMLIEAASNPNLAYWQRKAEEDADNASDDE